MRLGVRGKLFILSLILILGAVVAAGIYLEFALGNWLEARIAAELESVARSGRVVVNASYKTQPSIAAMDPLANHLGRATKARVTILDNDGKILGDSQLTVVEILLARDQGDRSEVVMARENGIGHSKRYSPALETMMLFVAVPYKRSDGIFGFVRAAMSLEDVKQAKVRLRWVLLLAGLFAMGAAISMSGLNAHFATRALRALVAHAHNTVSKHSLPRTTNFPSDEIGGLAGSFNQLQDELQSTMAALARERDQVQAVLEGMSEGVLTMDKNHVITLVNPSAIKLLGLEGSPVGQRVEDVIPVEAFQKLAATSGTLTTELDMPGSDLRRFAIHRTSTSFHEGCCVLVIRDITELHRQEQVRRDFVANVSHELRTPVSIILANVETLLDGAYEDEVLGRTMMEAVERHALRLSRLISDLLDLSRIESGRIDLQSSRIALYPLVSRVMESTRPLAHEKRIIIRNDVDAGKEVLADASAVEQVLFNLVDNAIKYTLEGGQIVVRSRIKKGAVRIEVEDNGVGIDPQHRPRIFERFYRADPSRSQETGSTGLGLPIVRRLVDAMGGKTGVKSVEPSGTLFWFTLPLPVSRPSSEGNE